LRIKIINENPVIVKNRIKIKIPRDASAAKE
jgi:hypothetical protein